MKLKSIKGLLPEKMPPHWVDSLNLQSVGFNKAIDQIGEKDLPKMDSVTKGWVRI